MTNPPLDLPAHTGSRTTRVLGAAVLVGVATMILLGFFVAPEDDLMADSVRMIFVHVPSAILTYVAFSVTAVGSVMWLWKRSVWWDIVAHSSAEIGVIFCGLTLITGSKGVFDVLVNGEVLYSKTETGRHAEPGEVLALFTDALPPDTSRYER